jgi:hypothetical protein
MKENMVVAYFNVFFSNETDGNHNKANQLHGVVPGFEPSIVPQRRYRLLTVYQRRFYVEFNYALST